MGHWQILMTMVHDHLGTSGFLNLISSHTKHQPVLELIWAVISRRETKSDADKQKAVERLASAESVVDVLASLAIMMALDFSGLRQDGKPVEFIIEIKEGKNVDKKRSRSASKSSKEHRHKSDKKKKKGKDSRSRSRSRSSSKKHKNKEKKAKKSTRESHYERDSSVKDSHNATRALNIVSLLLRKLLEFPHLSSSAAFIIGITYFTLEIEVSQWLNDQKNHNNLHKHQQVARSSDELQIKILKFLDQVTNSKESLAITPFERLCLNIMLSKLPTSNVIDSLVPQLHSSAIKLRMCRTWHRGIEMTEPSDTSFKSLSMIASAIHKGNFKKYYLGAMMVFDELNRSLELMSEDKGPEIVEKMLSSGWIDLLCFEVAKLHKSRKLDSEESNIIEAILAQLAFKTVYSLSKVTAMVELLQRDELMLSFSTMNHKEAKGLVDSLCKLLKYTPLPLSLEAVKVKKEAFKGRMLEYRELEFTQSAHEARFRVKKLFTSSKSEIDLASLLILLNKLSRTLEPGSQYFSELVNSKLFDALMQVIDTMTDLFWVCSYPEVASLEDTSKADLNPQHYLQVSLKALYHCTEMFKQKLEFMSRTRPSSVEYLNVDLICLCSLIYLTNVREEEKQISKMFKIEIDRNIEGILKAVGTFEADSGSKTDRVLNRLIELSLTSRNTWKSLVLLQIYISASNKQLSSVVVDTLLCQPSSFSKVPLRTLCAERSPLYLFDYMIDYRDRSVLHRLLDHILDIADLNCQIALRDTLDHLMKRGTSKLLEGIFKVIEKIAKANLVEVQSVRDANTQMYWHTNFYGILCTLAQNHIWKSIAVEGDLGDILLNNLERSLPSGWYESGNTESSINCFCLFLNFAEMLIDKRFGMSNQLGDYKEAKDGSHIEYLFEDLPKESLIQDILIKVDLFIQPVIMKLTTSNISSHNESSLQLILGWSKFLHAITRSTICQIMLLYGLYTKQVKPAGAPLISLKSLVDLMRTLKSPTGLQATGEFLVVMNKLLNGGEDKHPLRSERRLRAVDKLLGSDVIDFARCMASIQTDTRWHLMVVMQAEQLKADVGQCSSDHDREDNVSYLNSRDFNEILKRFIKLAEEDEKDAIKKLPKKSLSTGELAEVMTCLSYQINESVTECLLFEDIEARQWQSRIISELKFDDKKNKSQNKCFFISQADQEIQLLPFSHEQSNRIVDEDISTTPKISFGIFKEVIFQNNHRLIESKTYNPDPDTPRLTPHTSNNHVNIIPNSLMNSRISSTRAASTHVDNFRGVNKPTASTQNDKLNMSPTSRSEVSSATRPPPPPSTHISPPLLGAIPIHQFDSAPLHLAPHYPQPQATYIPPPSHQDYNPFAQPVYNPFPQHTQPTPKITKTDLQTLLSLAKMKVGERKYDRA